MSRRAPDLVQRLLQTAAADPRLSASHLRVLVLLCQETNARHYQPIKSAWMARRLRISDKTVTRATRRLASLGYVDQDRLGSGRVIHRFRLAATVPDPVAPFSDRGAA